LSLVRRVSFYYTVIFFFVLLNRARRAYETIAARRSNILPVFSVSLSLSRCSCVVFFSSKNTRAVISRLVHVLVTGYRARICDVDGKNIITARTCSVSPPPCTIEISSMKTRRRVNIRFEIPVSGSKVFFVDWTSFLGYTSTARRYRRARA